jgi:hypothetical protein
MNRLAKIEIPVGEATAAALSDAGGLRLSVV